MRVHLTVTLIYITFNNFFGWISTSVCRLWLIIIYSSLVFFTCWITQHSGDVSQETITEVRLHLLRCYSTICQGRNGQTWFIFLWIIFIFVYIAREPTAFPGHQPELDPPKVKKHYNSFLTTSRAAFGDPTAQK